MRTSTESGYSMLRREPQASLLIRAAGLLRQRLGRLVGRLDEDGRSRLGGEDLLPIRLRRMASPSVRSLEPRFVLNATAELNALGQLVVMGTDSAETVELQVEADGRLRLRDAIGDVIPIAGHPDGAIGQSNPLDPLSITSKQIIFDMRGGDDVLNLDLPSGLDVTVTSSAGNDTATVGGGNAASITPGGLTIDSETIRIDPATRSIAFGNSVDLTGDVSVGSIGQTTELSFADGGLAVSGSFNVTGDVRLAGTTGPVDLSNAILTSNSAGSDLSIDAMAGDVFLDAVDDSGGSALNDLRIDSAASVQFNGAAVELDGALVVRNVPGTTVIDSTVNAGSISIETQGDIFSNSRLTTDAGGIELSTTSGLVVNENLDTTLANVNGDVVLAGSGVQLNTMRVITSGGDVQIEGNTTIDGLVIIDTGNRQGAVTAGDVAFLGNVQSDAGITDVLRIDARGNQANGDFTVTGSIGNTPDASASVDLNGLIVDADQIAINSVGVTSGDIRLTGNAITSLGNTIRTSTSGNILIDAPVLLGTANTSVFAVESVRFTQSVNGQRSTGNLVINAGVNALFDDAISGIQELNVVAGNVARFMGPTTVDGAMNVEADSIRILGDVTTSDDAVNLRSTTQTLLTSGGIVAVGNAVITIDGGANALNPGVIDVGSGTLSSTASGDAVRLRNASSVLLGNTLVPNGNLLVNDIAGSVTQSSGTNIIVDRLTALKTGAIDLSNATNDVRSIEEIAANGVVTVNDTVGGLVVNRVNSSGNNVTLRTVGDMQLGEVAVTATNAVVQLRAGSINDLTDASTTDITARRVEMTAVSGIGNVNQVDLGGVRELRATTDSGGIDIAHIATSPLTVESLTANSGKVQLLQSGAGHALDLVSIQSSNGMINVVAEGTITAMNVVSSGMDQDISITATGVASDILVREIRAKNQSDILLTADDDILTTGDFSTSLIEADDLGLKAHNGTGDQAEAIRLRTQVADLVASTGNESAPTAVNRGDFKIVELDNINLASSDAAGDEIIETANGQIDISAINITVVDTSLNDEGSDQKKDPEIDANGAMGRVVLNATSTLTLNADVQIHAEKEIPALPLTQVLPLDEGLNDDARAVLLVADSIILGDNIEIFTGNDQGTARVFGPRPSVIPDDVTTERPIKQGSTRNGNAKFDANNNLIPSAFFDPDSISVNVLEQAAVNDANGILTVDIGQSGERGLSVSIDWGAGVDARRFQQLNNLSADQTIVFDVDATGKPLTPTRQDGGPGTLNVTHFYSQADILDSRMNNRTSATAPLNVLFSVQQHQSIIVRSNTIVQNGVSDAVPDGESVPGDANNRRLASSTDNPLTSRNAAPGLESGSVSFIIPSLSIPVAFFPVREVIPEIETPQFVVRAESKATLSQSTVETVETVTASTSTREEYFRLRVLSPDPDGEDLAEPEKLPEDILDGEKLSELFKRLPDGTYEIEYVLGDGDERTILRVEVRNGAAKLSVGDLEEGVLKLKRLKDTE